MFCMTLLYDIGAIIYLAANELNTFCYTFFKGIGINS